MLTHEDVHYLAGLLQIVTAGRPVEVELGSMVYDQAAEEERDVDVTVRYQATDGDNAMVGIEVKDEGRPLDVTKVEQLIAKMRDMSGLTHCAIVSASGYSEPAVRKAAAHGATLYEFEEWDTNEDPFWANMANLRTFGERLLLWENAVASFNDDEAASDELEFALANNAKIVREDGTAIKETPDVRALLNYLAHPAFRWLVG